MLSSYWSGDAIAHLFVSVSFGEQDYVAMSIETRKERTEEYSSIKRFFTQYELMYVVADERDGIRLRTTYRQPQELDESPMGIGPRAHCRRSSLAIHSHAIGRARSATPTESSAIVLWSKYNAILMASVTPWQSDKMAKISLEDAQRLTDYLYAELPGRRYECA